MQTSETTGRAPVLQADDEPRTGPDARSYDAGLARSGRTRRDLMKVAAVSGAAAAFVSGVAPLGGIAPAAAQEEELDDSSIAAFAESLELAAVETYKAIIGGGKVTTKAVLDAANVFMRHHQEHAAAFAAASAGKATGTANPKLVKGFSDQLSRASDERAVVRIALDVENAAASTHLLALSEFDNVDALKLTASILPVESAHAVTLAEAAGLALDSKLYFPAFETQENALAPDAFPLS